MARIPEEEIERIKGEIALEQVVEASGVALKPHGKDLVGRCPFHDDKTPSLVISPGRNLWHCLGACQTGGSVIDWVMKHEGISFRHAVELLREKHFPSLVADHLAASKKRTGRPAKDGRKVAKHSSSQKLPVAFDVNANDDQLLKDVAAYYHEQLLESPEALEYLGKRGLRDEALIEEFQLGFSNRTLTYRIPKKRRKDGDELRGRLEELGIFRQSGHEHLNGSIVFPICDGEGRVTEMYGRKVTPNLRKGTPQHTYLPGPHRGVWNHAGLDEEVILCESIIDAATFWAAGFRNVTASYGIEGFTNDHAMAFEQAGVQRVLIAYDRDDAGERAAEKLKAKLSAMGIQSERVLFPKGLDANEYALKVQPAGQSLALVVNKARAALGAAAIELVSLDQASATPGQSPQDDVIARTPEVEKESGFPLLVAEAAATPKAEESPLPLAPKPASLSTQQARTAPPVESGAGGRVSRQSETSTLEKSGDDLLLQRRDRRWRIRRLGKASPGHLKVNLLVSRSEQQQREQQPSGGFHVDTLELYSARQRQAFVEQACLELGCEREVLKQDLAAVLMQLEELIDREQRAAEAARKKEVKLSDAEHAEAMAFLKSPKLLDELLADFESAGIVGEHTNKLVGYLAATSRKLDEPLAVVVQSSSAAGKSSLMDAILEMIPEEDRVQYSAMTGQSLYYMGEEDLCHKVLAISEEEGAERASYALKLLQSEGQLKIASTGKDPNTGRLVTQEYQVAGPVMIFLTTTAIDIDEELLNRCLVLSVDEGRQQTRAIHERQRLGKTLEGVVAKRQRRALLKKHQNAQRLLRPLAVVNPLASELRFPDHQTRTRRDHKKYLAVIEAVAFLHQHQREVKRTQCGADGGDEWLEYIEVSASDVEVANELCREVLGKTLDELPPGTRKLLGLLEQMVDEQSREFGIEPNDYRFSRREVRQWTRLGDTQVRVHLRRLLELEYVAVHRGRQGQGYVYELCYAGEEPDLFDTSTTSTSRGSEATSRGVRGGSAGVGGAKSEATKTAVSPDESEQPEALRGGDAKSRRGERVNGTSYRTDTLAAAGLRKTQPLQPPAGA